MDRERESFTGLPERAQAFDDHLSSLPWREVRNMMIQEDSYGLGCANVICGIKPAFVLEYEKYVSKAKGLIPPTLSSKIIITQHGWIADIDAVAAIIRQHDKHFPDAEIDRLQDPAYVQLYLEQRKCTYPDTFPEEIIKTGLLLGFPCKSVLEYSKLNKSLVDFEEYGYNLSILPEDAEAFRNELRHRHVSSGLGKVLERQTSRIQQAFEMSLTDEPGSMEIVTIGENSYLKLLNPDPDTNTLVKQLLLLTDRPLSKNLVETFVDAFGHRYSASSMTRTLPDQDNSEQSIGVNHEDTTEAILSRTTGDKLAYLQLNETCDGYSTVMCTIDATAFVNWLPDDVREEIVSLLE